MVSVMQRGHPPSLLHPLAPGAHFAAHLCAVNKFTVREVIMHRHSTLGLMAVGHD